MSVRHWGSALLVACLGAAAPAGAAEILSVSAGPTRDPGVYYMDAMVVVDAPPMALRTVIYQVCDHRAALPNVAYCRMFRAQGQTAWSYMVIDVPIFEPRDYTIASTVDQDLNPDGTGVFKSHWVIDNASGPSERHGVTRLDVNQGSWTMKPVDGGRRTQLHYTVRVSPGGNIPSWVAGYVSKRTLPEYMRTLERLAQREHRRSSVATVSAPRPGTFLGAQIRPLETPLPPVRSRFGSHFTAFLP